MERFPYKDHGLRLLFTRFGVLLAHCDEFLGPSLCFLRFGPCRLDGFVLDERCDQIAEKSTSVSRVSGEMAVFDQSAGHVGGLYEEIGCW